VPPIGPSSELTHAGRPYELTLLVSTVLVSVEARHYTTRVDQNISVFFPFAAEYTNTVMMSSLAAAIVYTHHRKTIGGIKVKKGNKEMTG